MSALAAGPPERAGGWDGPRGRDIMIDGRASNGRMERVPEPVNSPWGWALGLGRERREGCGLGGHVNSWPALPGPWRAVRLGQQLAELRVPRCAQQGRPTHNAPEAVGPGQAPLSRPQVAGDLAGFPWALGFLRCSSSGARALWPWPWPCPPPPFLGRPGTRPRPVRRRIFGFASLVWF